MNFSKTLKNCFPLIPGREVALEPDNSPFQGLNPFREKGRRIKQP